MLYVHVPFCLSVCPYCDFVVYAGADARGPRSRTDAFVAALHAELDLRADVHEARFGSVGAAGRLPLASVYVGGGTPSLLAAGQLAELLAHVERRFRLAADAEVTLEVNPGADDLGDLAGFRAAGVNRLSIGAQSLDAAELRAIGRRHTAADVLAAVGAARVAGIRSISLDLLYDLPGQATATWGRTLHAALALPIDHLSAYALDLADPDAEGLTGSSGDHLPVRRGARRWRERARAGQDDDRAAEMYALADERLAAAGFQWYELSNWARRGHESRHNLGYWQGLAYEAIGPGAHAFDGVAARRWNAARLDGYLAALTPSDGSPPSLPPGSEEWLEPATRSAERRILGLRLASGIRTSTTAAPALAWASDHDLLEPAGDDRIRLSLRGRLLSNEVFGRLL
jgi:oxygen-independent coproporphyrinogen-3 oxidase